MYYNIHLTLSLLYELQSILIDFDSTSFLFYPCGSNLINRQRDYCKASVQQYTLNILFYGI